MRRPSRPDEKFPDPWRGPSLPTRLPPPADAPCERCYEFETEPATPPVKAMKIALHTHLKPGVDERDEGFDRAVWPEVLDGMRSVGITKYVIVRDGLDTSSPAN